MNKVEVQKYIETIQNMGSVYGLDSIRELLRRLGNPQDRLKIVHIAGTNGKGSILAMLNEILKTARLRCGRYISPTIFTYLERFQINGTYMEEGMLAELMTIVAEKAKAMEAEGLAHPTLFELETAVAFLWFLRENVDVVLLETGMGGRMDSTNVIQSPICVLFASISRDHMEFLGNTLVEIATEKAGIIKEGCPVIAYPNTREVRNVIQKEAKAHKAKLIQVEEQNLFFISGDLSGQKFSYKQYQNMTLSLLGHHQLYNAAVVLEAIEVLKQYFIITKDQVQKGLSNVKWKGRFEILRNNPIWIRDGAHNEDAALKLRDALEENFAVTQKKAEKADFTNQKIFYIIGVLADKEYEKMLEITAPLADYILTITPDNKRALPSDKLAQVARNYLDQVIDCKTLNFAVSLVHQLAKEQDLVVVFGSLSFLGELKVSEELKENCSKIKREQKLKEERFPKIMLHPLYREALKRNQEAEQGRIFCKHTIEHFLDVARIAYIKVLEQKLELSKDLIYGAALLHDIGRFKQVREGISHDKASACLAEPILWECGYTEKEIVLIQEAILSHRENKTKAVFNQILYEADKQARLCLFCEAKEECNWSEEKKNKEIYY